MEKYSFKVCMAKFKRRIVWSEANANEIEECRKVH